MKSPSNWVNLQDYLGVNEEKSQEMQQKVAGQVGDQAQAATDELGAAQNTFNAKAQAGANAAPTDQSKTDPKQAYSGPNNLGDVDPNLEKNVKDANDRINASKTYNGQQAEVGQAYGAKSTGSGLDSFLLSGAGASGGDAMQSLYSQYGDLAQTGMDANNASIETGRLAKRDATRNASNRGFEASQRQSEADSHAAADKSFHDDKQLDADFEKAMQTNAGDHIRSGLQGASIIHRAYRGISAGKNDPATGLASKMHGGDSSGGTGRSASDPNGGNGQHIWWKPEHKAVYKQMTPDQWDELRGLSSEDQGDWLNNRMVEVQKGMKHGDYRTQKYGAAGPIGNPNNA